MAAPFLLEPAGGGAWLLNEINNITTSEYPDFLKLPCAVSGLYYSLMIHTVMHSIVGAFIILCRTCRIRGPSQRRDLRVSLTRAFVLQNAYLASVNNLFLALYFCTTNVIRTGIVRVANALST